MRVLILGASGMLGTAMYHSFSEKSEYEVFGTSRISLNSQNFFNFDAQLDNLSNLFEKVKPDLIINCIGIIKQIKDKVSEEQMIKLNAIFPKNLQKLCMRKNVRLIHFSTDCVFDGKKGSYADLDICNAEDLYGRSKYLGEVEGKNILTLRTSIIGHERNKSLSLVDWFLAQNNKVNGYKNAIFSGFTTNELAKIVIEKILPLDISGIRNISSNPISKYELLSLIKNVYKKDIKIVPCDKVKIDRSLNSDIFVEEIGYKRKDWELMVKEMKNFYIKYYVQK